jgi:glycosyltransferase involved in cell wall biosynthesis
MVRANELESIGMRGDGVRYIANGVDVYKFKPVKHRKRLRKELGFPQNDLLILSVGRISQIKNPASLIDIFSLLEKYCRQVTLIIVGGGENENGLRELVDRKGVRNVIFLGFVQHEKIAKVYACADVYIISSIYEGASPPLTLAEALASGLPCIVSNVPSLASVITDANAGIVIDFSNKTNAAKQIVEYIHNREERLEHAVNARAYAVKNLDWVRIAQKYLKELQRL